MQLSHVQSFQQSLVISQQLRQAIVLLRMSNAELQAFIETQSEENPFVELARPRVAPAPTTSRLGPSEDWDRIAALPDNGCSSLFTHIARQIGAWDLPEAEIELATAFVEALEPSGWLGATVEEIAMRACVAQPVAEAMLARLQTLDPVGVFARSLSECLRLQARERDLLTPVMACVLDHLPMLAAADLAGLARVCRCDGAELRETLKLIRSFDPKPGARFDHDPQPIRPPDLIVTQTDDGAWQVELNRSTLPAVVVRDEDAKAIVKSAKRREGVGGYVSDRLSVARWLSRAVDHRNQTVLNIGHEIVRRQTDFMRHGPSRLQPMILREVAEQVGVHESTVSRVTSGILMATPHGTFPLKSFFTAALGARDDATAGSAGAVRFRIEKLIRAEPAGKPLSDDQLVKLLEQEGIAIARRTVAKYREQLDIAPSSVRRRQAILSGRV